MKILFLFIFSISSVAIVGSLSYSRKTPTAQLVLRQQIQLLESNSLRNILREQNIQKRDLILSSAIHEIEKLRIAFPVQLKKDEKAISKIVLNLKSMDSKTQAQYKGLR